jgi:hypothetical protein
MGKSEENKTVTRAHEATNCESKYKKQPSFDSIGSGPFAVTFADNDEGLRRSQWQDRFRQMCEYKIQFGHCIVPQQYAANPKLGRWVQHQRSHYRKHTEEEETSMTAEHIRALNGIGFNWGTSKNAIWNVRLEQLCEFKAQFGHYLVPKQYSAKPELGRWVSRQRNNYKLYQEGKSGPMTAERIQKLESVGFELKTSSAAFWSVKFQQLCKYKTQFGHCLVPCRYSENPKLGQWVATQRQLFKLFQEGKPSRMTAERIQKLESVGFIWKIRFLE